jgi:hypothetical protein
MEDNMTAVDWLFRKLWDQPKDKLIWWSILNNAKTFEMEQIIMAYHNGYSDAIKPEPKQYDPKQYYEQTYGK